jgi:hypothetical protein
MHKLILLFFLIAYQAFGHSPMISTMALVKDSKGQWTLHISASSEAFQAALADKKMYDAEAYQNALIQFIKSSTVIRSNLLNPATLNNGQCRLGHQTDVKFIVDGIPEHTKALTIKNQTFQKLNNHFAILKVIDGKMESNQFVLEPSNKFSADVTLTEDAISIASKNKFNFYYLLLIAPVMLLFLIKIPVKKILSLSIIGFYLVSCNKNDSAVTPTDVIVPDVYKKIYGAESVTSDGTYIIIKTKDLPDHKSPYYPESNSLYESYSGLTFGGLTFIKNPNSIIEQSGTFKIPVEPKVASNHVATPLGPIGIALNGVPFFNQYAGPNNQELKGEMATFDQFYGHPQQSGIYHYHVEPLQLTTVKSTKSGLVGFLLDGFPVYGPEEEDGSVVSNDNLDVYHGHTHPTIDYPNGTYHYHFTTEAPYLNGNGFYGTPGTISQ